MNFYKLKPPVFERKTCNILSKASFLSGTLSSQAIKLMLYVNKKTSQNLIYLS